MFRNLNREMKWYLAFFLIATLGGAVRKWFTDSGAVSNLILLTQMLIPFFIFLRRGHYTVSPFQKFPILYAYFAYMAFHIIYPMQLTFFHGIMGMIVHGAFWLFLFFYLANRHAFKPDHLMKLFIIIGIGEVILGFMQYALPTDNILNRYANMEIINNIAIVGDRVRITGSFSYLSGYTAYLLWVNFLIWAMIRLKYPAWTVFVATGCAIITAFMTGSRSAVGMTVIFLLPLYIQLYSFQTLFVFFLRLLIPAAIVTAVIMLYKEVPIAAQITKAYENFMGRVEANRQSGEEASRLNFNFLFFTDPRFISPLFGVGLGSTYQGATILFGTSIYVLQFGYVEGEWDRVMLEGGMVMLAFKLLLSFILIRKLEMKGLMRWIIFFTINGFNPIVFNVHNAAFIAMGIVLVDNIIWRQRLAAEALAVKRQTEEQAPVPEDSPATPAET